MACITCAQGTPWLIELLLHVGPGLGGAEVHGGQLQQLVLGEGISADVGVGGLELAVLAIHGQFPVLGLSQKGLEVAHVLAEGVNRLAQGTLEKEGAEAAVSGLVEGGEDQGLGGRGGEVLEHVAGVGQAVEVGLAQALEGLVGGFAGLLAQPIVVVVEHGGRGHLDFGQGRNLWGFGSLLLAGGEQGVAADDFSFHRRQAQG